MLHEFNQLKRTDLFESFVRELVVWCLLGGICLIHSKEEIAQSYSFRNQFFLAVKYV